jgi:hypothetical protein
VNIKKLLPYAGALIALVVAIVALTNAVSSHKDTPASWDALAASVKQVGVASDLAATTAIANKDVTVCIVSKSASGIAAGVAESASLAGTTSTCHIPDVTVDVTACLPAPVATAEAASTAPVAPAAPATPAAPAAEPEVSETSEAAPADVTVAVSAAPAVTPDVVSGAVAPIVTVVKAALAKSDATPNTKAWGAGVLTWLDSGRPSIAALVADPSTGKLTLKGVDVVGCTP